MRASKQAIGRCRCVGVLQTFAVSTILQVCFAYAVRWDGRGCTNIDNLRLPAGQVRHVHIASRAAGVHLGTHTVDLRAAMCVRAAACRGGSLLAHTHAHSHTLTHTHTHSNTLTHTVCSKYRRCRAYFRAVVLFSRLERGRAAEEQILGLLTPQKHHAVGEVRCKASRAIACTVWAAETADKLLQAGSERC